jgi:hypothetical protein
VSKKRVAVLVTVAAVLVMMLAAAGTAGAKPDGGTKAIGQGQGSANACKAFVKQLGHGKSAHAKDLDRLAQKLDQHGCPPAPPCVATNSCDDPAEPPPLGDAVSCDGALGTCVIVQGPVITLAGISQSGPSAVGPGFPVAQCTEAEPYLYNWSYTTSSSALTATPLANPISNPEVLTATAANWSWSSSNTFQFTVACTSQDNFPTPS